MLSKNYMNTLTLSQKGLYEDSTDVFRALLAKLIEQPEETQTFERLLEMAEKFAARYE